MSPSGSAQQGQRIPRRSAPSPRIQALADRFESGSSILVPGPERGRRSSISADAETSNVLSIRPTASRTASLPPIDEPNTVVRGALGQMNWQPIRSASVPSPALPSNNADSKKSGRAADGRIRTASRSAKPPASSGLRVETDVRTGAIRKAQATPDGHELRERSPLQPFPAVPVAPSVRKIDAAPAKPMRNVSIEMGRLHSPRRLDGLPPSSGSPLPNFPDEEPVPLPDPLPSTRPLPAPSVRAPSSTESEGEQGQGHDGQDSDEEPLVEHGQNGQGVHSCSPVQPVPAAHVFDRDAYPLHLPDLDEYLDDKVIFPLPRFSDASPLCTDEEARLYGFQTLPSSFAAGFEVCGAQISVPPDSLMQDGLRRRNNVNSTRPDGPLKVEDDLLEQGLHSDTVQALSKSSSSDTMAADADVEKTDYAPPTRPISSNIPSSAATKDNPKAKQQMFPPLMLLKENSLDELKSNAVGPRKPPGGLLGSLPGIGSLLGTIVDFVVGVEGSTLAAGIFRLQLFMDFVQIMDLNLHFTSALRTFDRDQQRWTPNYVLLRVVPAMVSLNFVSVFGAAIIILLAFTGVVAVLLVLFWRMTRMYNPNRTLEGFASQPWLFRPVKRSSGRNRARLGRQPDDDAKPWRSTLWTKFSNVSIVMLLTTLYIPLSKLAVDALVWSVDYWPAQGGTTTAEAETSGFCYRTTTNAQAFNWAFVIIPVASLTVVFYTLWYPFQMMRTIHRLLPRVNEYNELGNKRTNGEMETEYMRMLDHDSSPLNFMYNAYRRKWGTYKPLYILCFKLSNLLIISIFTQQNCLFHKFDTKTMLIIQQSVLITLQTVLFATHLYVQPFVDMISNRSELVSRFGYVSTAIIGLLVALQVKGSTVYQSALLYVVQAMTYTGNIYFSLAGTSWMSHWIKRIQVRLDFSIDVFSPMLQLDKHVKRRVWQETLSTILLSGPEYRMPIGQLVTFSIDDHWPPYLLQFCGTAAERHLENLKILKAIGMEQYKSSIETLRDQGDAERWKSAMTRIQIEFAGPDAYWQPLNVGAQIDRKALQCVSSFFGKAFLVPFPPTLVMHYDQTADGVQDATIQLTTLQELEAFIWQNESKAVQHRRWVRTVLRSLDGQKVYCPHVEAVKISAQGRIHGWLSGMDGRASQYTLAKPVFYEEGLLTVQRNATPTMGDYNFQSGFEVYVSYTHGQRRDADGLSIDRTKLTIDGAAAFGLRDDFEYTTSVEKFISDNESTVSLRMPQLRQLMQGYRLRYYREAVEKRKTMEYAFLTEVFDRPCWQRDELVREFRQSKLAPVIRQLPSRYLASSTLLVERIAHIHRTRVHKWWYIFWDDLWRQNNGDFAGLRNHPQTFSPHFPTSIAYTPMSRIKLEALLKSKKGVWAEDDPGAQFFASTSEERERAKSSQKQSGLFNRGLLNRIYFLLDEIAFDRSLRSPGEAQPGAGRGEALVVGTIKPDGSMVVRSMATLSASSEQKDVFRLPLYVDPFAATSRHTGGGTDQDDSSIIERYAWPWTEQRLSGRPSRQLLKRIKGHILEWLSIRPYKLHSDIEQLYIYLRLVDGRYEAANSRPSIRENRY